MREKVVCTKGVAVKGVGVTPRPDPICERDMGAHKRPSLSCTPCMGGLEGIKV